MFEFLIVGGWLFWSALFVVSCFIWGSENSSSRSRAGWASVIFLLVFGWQFLKLTHSVSPALMLSAVGAYIVIGAFWSVWKWWLHCSRLKDLINEKGQALSSYERNSIRVDLTVSQNKGRLTYWIAYWPWSMLFSLLHDTVEAIFNWLRRIYMRLANPATAALDALGERPQ